MSQSSGPIPEFWRSPAALGLAVVMVVGGFYLVTEHRAHLIGALPYHFVLACPLMHLFMHRGHGHHDHGDGQSRSSSDEQRGQ